jgi:hypothetical protein
VPRKTLGEYTGQDIDSYVEGGWRKGWLGRQTPLGLTVKVVIALIALSMLSGIIGYVGGWFNEGKRIVSPANVRKTWAEAYQLDRAATAQARIVCRTAQSSGLANTVSGPPLLAAESTYDHIWARYSEVVSNKLEGGLVLPPNLPSKNATLTERLSAPDVGCPQKVIDKISGGLK